jgi:hypothetical protein
MSVYALIDILERMANECPLEEYLGPIRWNVLQTSGGHLAFTPSLG